MAAQPGIVRAAALSPARLAGLALLLTAAWIAFQGAYVYDGAWRGLVRASSEFSLPEALRADLPLLPVGRGYDGQFYRVIAHDPWPPFSLDPSMDAPSVRRQRIPVPALARVLAAGQAAWQARKRETPALLALPFLGLALLLGAPEALGSPYAYRRSLGPVFATVLWTGAAQRAWWFAAAVPACAGVAAYSAAALLRGLGWGT